MGLSGQAVDVAGGHLGPGALHVSEGEGAQMGRPPVHRQGVPAPDVLLEPVRVAAVVPHVDDDGGEHLVHADVVKQHVVDDAVLSPARRV